LPESAPPLFRKINQCPKKRVCALEKVESPVSSAPASRAHFIAVCVILVVAGFVRYAALDQYPLPIHQDELSDIYDGYSLATTGADRWGEPWPILFRGMGPGDYHPGLYAYCAAVSIKLFGFSVWAGRLPAAIAGILTVLLVYLVARRLLSPPASLIAVLLVAFSPIQILYSRQAHTGVCMMPLAVILILYLMIRLLESLRSAMTTRPALVWAVACGITVGLSTNAYAAMRLVAPLLAITIVVAVFTSEGLLKNQWKKVAAIVCIFTIATTVGSWPQLYAAMNQPEHFFARSSTTAYSLSNGFAWWAKTLARHLMRELDPKYLFLSFGEYRALSIARLSIAELPFLYVGLFTSIVLAVCKRNIKLALLPVTVVICLLPSMVTRGGPNPMRSSGVWALYPIASAIGIGITAQLAATILTPLGRSLCRQIATVCCCAAIAGIGIFNTHRYLANKPLHGPASQHQLVVVGQSLARADIDEYPRVYVDVKGMFGYLYVAAFSGMPPARFQSAARTGHLRGLGWEEFDTFGRFHFASTNQAIADRRNAKTNENWLIVTSDGSNVQTRELPPLQVAQN